MQGGGGGGRLLPPVKKEVSRVQFDPLSSGLARALSYTKGTMSEFVPVFTRAGVIAAIYAYVCT